MSSNPSPRPLSWFQRLVRWMPRRKQAASRRHAARRPLNLETLETRTLMSADVLPSISGVAFRDMTENGLTADDLRLSGVTINLFRDGGDGQFTGKSGGDDHAFGTTLTASNGTYRFDDLDVGTYFVQQVGVPGIVFGPGGGVAKIVITDEDLAGIAGTAIDTFGTTSQLVRDAYFGGKTTSSAAGMNVPVVGGTGVTLTSAAPDALGGYRTLFIQRTSRYGSISLGANADVPGTLDFASGSISSGKYWVTWDGQAAGSSAINPNGLGQRDLTDQGASSGLRLVLGADHDGAAVTVKIYSGASNWSWASVPITNTDNGEALDEVYVPWTEFTVGGGTGADFTKVGAIRMEIDGVASADGQVGPIEAIGPKVIGQNFVNYARTDLAVVKTDSPDPVTAGNQLTYTLTISNNGPSTATGVTAIDTLPPGVTYASTTLSQGTYTINNGVLTLNVGQLASGATATATILVNVAPGTTGTLTNTATVSGNETETTLTNNTSTVTTTVASQVDLSITKTDSPNPVTAGNQLTYTLAIRNNGPSNATGVTIVDTLPPGVSYVSATSSQGSVTNSGGVLTVSAGDLAAGGAATVTVTVLVAPGTTGTLTNTATVSGNQTETNMSNNTATVNTPVNTVVDLAVTKIDDPDPIVAGNKLTYTITARNNGPSTSTGVTILDTLPAGVTYYSGTSSRGTVSASGGKVTIDVGNLATGEIITATIVVDVAATAQGTLTNTAKISGSGTETNLMNNTATATTRVDVPVVPRDIIDLAITKIDTPDPVSVLSNLTYTLHITNDSIDAATGVVVTDTLPSYVTLVSAETTQGTISASGRTITANLGTMEAGGDVTITIVVNVSSQAGSTLTNTATVRSSGNEDEADATNNTATAVTQVVRPVVPRPTKTRYLFR